MERTKEVIGEGSQSRIPLKADPGSDPSSSNPSSKVIKKRTLKQRLKFWKRMPLGWRDGIYPPITINDRVANKKQKFPSNELVTSVYTLIDFFPKNLIIQFSKYWNLFFLLVTIISFIPGVSPFNPATSVVPLAFVVGISMAKDAWEDIKRHRADYEANTRTYKVLKDSFQEIASKDIKTGDIVRVEKGSEFPVDMVLLKTSNPDGVCHVQTANLDGETSTKMHNSIKKTYAMSDAEIMAIKGVINSERNSHILNEYTGNVSFNGEQAIPLDYHNLNLRGSRLVLTEYVLGVAVFTGTDTKLALNLPSPSHKFSKLDKIMNMTVLSIFIGHELVCIAFAIAGSQLYSKTLMNSWYLGETDSVGVYGVKTFFSFFALLAYCIPISLMILWEIIKLVQGKFMSWDLSMTIYDPEDDIFKEMVVRNSNLNDELARVCYLFSDKTGTLTSNKMEFKQISINGNIYKKANEGEIKKELLKDKKFQQNPLFIFMLNLALNQTSIVEKGKKGEDVFIGPSPDESALLMGAYNNGFKFRGKKIDVTTLEIFEKEAQFKILHILEFTPERRRMSVIVEDQDKRIYLFTKGADSEIKKRLKAGNDDLVTKTNQHVDEFATEGLRTLFFAYRELSRKEFDRFDKEYLVSSASLQNRAQKMETVMTEFEQDLILQGATGIEDKLQDQVPETIQFFLQANIRVWMITGDKRETAENIGRKCALLKTEDSVLQICVKTSDECRVKLEEGIRRAKSEKLSIIIDGDSITCAIPLHEELFGELGSLCQSVICCRTAPETKASVVRVMKKYTNKITASVGDGANDVAMLQEAHIGIGLFGKEGTQAARSADYASLRIFFTVDQSRFRPSTVSSLSSFFVHELKLMFLVFIFPQFYYAFWSGFTAQTLYDEWVLATFNSVLVILPPLYIGICDKDLTVQTVLSNPKAFWEPQSGKWFTAKTFLWWILLSLYQGTVLYFIPFAVFYPSQAFSGNGQDADIWANSVIFATALIFIVIAQASLVIKNWDWIAHFSIWFSLCFAILIYACESQDTFFSLAPQQYGVYDWLFRTGVYFFTSILTAIIAIVPSYLFSVIQWQYFPWNWQILREQERIDKIKEGDGRYCGCCCECDEREYSIN